jgi:peroxiredoxin
LADYGHLVNDFTGEGVQIAALSVDDPERSRDLRARLALPYPLLTDPGRDVVRAWGLYNPKEAGGIARPATYLLGPGRTVLFRNIDEVAARAQPSEMLAYLREGKEPPARRLSPRLGDFAGSLVGMLRFGKRSPRQ